MAISRTAVLAGVLTVALLGGTMGFICHHWTQARKPFLADDYITDGMTDAVDEAAGVELTSLEVSFVTPDGRVHTEHRGKLTMSWEGPGEGATTAAMPGAPRRGNTCNRVHLSVELEEDDESVSLRPFMTSQHNMGCDDPTAPGPLRCTIAAIWQRAIEAHAPNPAMATIKLETTRDTRTRIWHFTVEDHVVGGPSKTLFSADFPDDCLPRVER